MGESSQPRNYPDSRHERPSNKRSKNKSANSKHKQWQHAILAGPKTDMLLTMSTPSSRKTKCEKRSKKWSVYYSTALSPKVIRMIRRESIIRAESSKRKDVGDRNVNCKLKGSSLTSARWDVKLGTAFQNGLHMWRRYIFLTQGHCKYYLWLKLRIIYFFLKKIESHFHIKRIYVPSIRESLMTIAKNWTKSFLFIYFSSVISKG